MENLSLAFPLIAWAMVIASRHGHWWGIEKTSRLPAHLERETLNRAVGALVKIYGPSKIFTNEEWGTLWAAEAPLFPSCPSFGIFSVGPSERQPRGADIAHLTDFQIYEALGLRGIPSHVRSALAREAVSRGWEKSLSAECHEGIKPWAVSALHESRKILGIPTFFLWRSWGPDAFIVTEEHAIPPAMETASSSGLTGIFLSREEAEAAGRSFFSL